MPNLLRRTFVLACLLASFQAYADDAGTTDEAKAMALRAADFLRQEGPEKAFPVFNDKTDGRFHDRDLYVMVYDTTGTNVAHGANAALIGKNLIDLKDTSGKLLIRELVLMKDQAFVDYTELPTIN
ncbi:MAG: cache domain-containing protein [Rhodopila sp.]